MTFENLPDPTFTHVYVRPGDTWPDTSAGTRTVLFIIAGSALPLAFDQAKLSAELQRCSGVFLSIDEEAWRWVMKAMRTVANEAELPALSIIVECSAETDLLWLDIITKHSRCLGMTPTPLPSLPRQLN